MDTESLEALEAVAALFTHLPEVVFLVLSALRFRRRRSKVPQLDYVHENFVVVMVLCLCDDEHAVECVFHSC